MPDVPGFRRGPSGSGDPNADDRGHLLAPWDGPAAIVFSDGLRVGAILDRNGLRPLAYAISDRRLVVAASEAGAFDLPAASTVRRGRLGPGEMLVVEPSAGLIHLPGQAEAPHLVGGVLRGPRSKASRPFVDRTLARPDTTPMEADRRFLAGLDAERFRLDIRTMVIEGHEPLWSMGDDTPTPALARTDRPVTDHLRQAFAQVTNPPIDSERERAVVDCRSSSGRADRSSPAPVARCRDAGLTALRGRPRRAAAGRTDAYAPPGCDLGRDRRRHGLGGRIEAPAGSSPGIRPTRYRPARHL
jgi:hypothetical protein